MLTYIVINAKLFSWCYHVVLLCLVIFSCYWTLKFWRLRFPTRTVTSPSRVHPNFASRVLIPILCSSCPAWHLPSVLCRLNIVQFEPKCTVPQSINHQRLSVEVRVRFHVSPHMICGGQSGTDTGFLRLLQFPLSGSFHQCSIPIQFPLSGSFHQCSIPIHVSPTAHNLSNCHRH